MRKLCYLAIVLLAGCASERFGREQHLTTLEKSTLSCDQIDLEIAKTDEFLKEVQSEWDDTKARRFWAFLVDVGIGDRRERDDAIKSADDRRIDLWDLRRRKNCPGTAEARPETD